MQKTKPHHDRQYRGTGLVTLEAGLVTELATRSAFRTRVNVVVKPKETCAGNLCASRVDAKLIAETSNNEI